MVRLGSMGTAFLTALGIALVLCAPGARAQGTPVPFVYSQWFNNNGQPCAGCYLYTYESGTTTPLATYEDSGETTENANPVVLDSAGRAKVFLGTSAYTFELTLSTGTELWSIDGISSSPLQILSLDNTWTGTNTFSAATTFSALATLSAGLTANGPADLESGGAMSGTFTGSPSFSGTPTFSSGFTSTVATGTAPFTVDSTTQVANLNASELEGDTWEAPGTIGSTTPSTAAFTTLSASTSFSLAGATALTAVQGKGDTNLLAAGTVSSTAGLPLCTDANYGATTSSCTAEAGAAFYSATLSSNVSVSASTATALGSCSGTCTGLALQFTTPSTGGPWRLLIPYALIAKFGGGCDSLAWVQTSDANNGTEKFGYQHEGMYDDNRYYGVTQTIVSPVTYAASTAVTVVIYFQINSYSGTIYAVDPVFSAGNSAMEAWLVASN